MKKTTAAAALFLALSSTTMSAAHADILTYYFASSGIYNGTSVKDAEVFATAIFTDVSGGVSLAMSVKDGLDAGGYVNDWAFNSSVTNLSVTYAGGKDGVEARTFEVGNNAVNSFGGTGSLNDYDLAFHFSNQNGQLAVGATSTYILTGTNLSTASFNVGNAIGIFSAVHVQGYGNNSSYYQGVTDQPLSPAAVPEPGIVALLGLGLLGFAAARRKAGKGRAA